MVVDYGMSSAIGPVTLGHERSTFLNGPGEQRAMREHGEQLADLVDHEVKRIVEGAERTAREVLTARRDVLDHIAAALLDKEYIDGEEFRRLLTAEGVALAPAIAPAVTAAE
jgi:cell division protease FtsH